MRFRQARVVEKLLELGADANAKFWNGTTPLRVAAFSGNQDAVEMLIKHGADVNAATQRAEIPLPVADQLMSASSHGVTTPLHEAVQNGHRNVVVVLLAHGARVDATTGVHSASASDGGAEEFPNIPIELLAFGRSVDISLFAGNSPLHLAAANATDEEVVKVLLAARADVNVANVQGWTPLQLAVHKSQKGNVIELLKHGADPNISAGGFTPLHDAAARGNADIAAELLARGADADATAWSGETPIQVAIKFKHLAVEDVLSTFASHAGDIGSDATRASP